MADNISHNISETKEEIILHPSSIPSLDVGKIVEISHPELDFARLLLLVSPGSLRDDLKGICRTPLSVWWHWLQSAGIENMVVNKIVEASRYWPDCWPLLGPRIAGDAVSVESSVVETFHLRDRLYDSVNVRLVEPAGVALDSVELLFRDQYLNRSDMWRLKNSLVRRHPHWPGDQSPELRIDTKTINLSHKTRTKRDPDLPWSYSRLCTYILWYEILSEKLLDCETQISKCRSEYGHSSGDIRSKRLQKAVGE